MSKIAHNGGGYAIPLKTCSPFSTVQYMSIIRVKQYCLKVFCPQLSTCPWLRTRFNPMYIPEPLDLWNHHSHRCVTHHLKCISSQGFWIVLIGFRTDLYWKAGGWIFWCFCPSLIIQKLCTKYVEPGTKLPKLLELILHVCNQTTTSLWATPDTPLKIPTRLTLLNMTPTTYSFQTHLYFHLAAVGLVDLKWTHTNWHCHPLIADWFMNWEAGRRRRISTNAHW